MKYDKSTSAVIGSRPRRFLSLKWKALLSTSLVLVVVIVAITLRSYSNLSAQFERYRHIAHERYTKDVQMLIEQSLNRLRQLASILPSLPGMQSSLSDGNGTVIRAAFEPHWPVMQLDWGLDIVAFYDPASRLLASWVTMTWQESRSQQVLSWIKQVNQSEKVLTRLSCSPDCVQYAIVPILAQGRSVGVLLVGNSLAEVLRSYRLVSDNDIGLLVSGHNGSRRAEAGRWLSQWDSQVVALTNAGRNFQVLKKAAATTSLSAATAGIHSMIGERSYEVLLVPLPRLVGRSKAYLAVIAEITDTLNEIQVATREIIIGGGTGWLLSELLLLIVLWTPMSRLRLTAENLPLLAQRHFAKVQHAILGQFRRHLLDDETDMLNATTLALADRLRQLEQQVEEHTRALSRRMQELSQERDFNASLLDIAQVVIVTQDRLGRIVMANTFAQTLIGYPASALIGHDFINTLFPQGAADLGHRLKAELTFGKNKHFRHESLVTCKNGTMRNITWYHSRLVVRFPSDPVILSVGLDVTERLGAESRLAWLADHDTLTGLVNRRRFQEELEGVLAAVQYRQLGGALLLIDLDHFKYFNDTYGHYSGDNLLKAVSKMLSSTILSVDLVARLGSDEFAVLLREADIDSVVKTADNIQRAFNSMRFAAGEQMVHASASIGIVLFPQHADTVKDLLASADFAMLQAKEEGRGRWHIFSRSDATGERMRSRLYWNDQLSQALADDRFMLHYQPIVDIKSRQVSHYEVLLRLRYKDGSVAGPAQFIDTAERIGMIGAIDRMVISKAIRFLAELKRRDQTVAFAINLSGHAFTDPQLLSHLRSELEQNGIEASRIIFEITETAAVSDFAMANSLMLAIKKLGCRFALDDFGIGFSSFYYLKHLPVDYLKIDGSFIRHLADSLEDQIIVQAISQIATGFGKKIVAEFVETEATLAVLRDYNVDYVQGFLISQPLSAEEVFGEPLLAHQ